MEPSDESLALLGRLSSKPGVQSTLVLTRSDGAIIRSEGVIARDRKRGESSAALEPRINGSNKDSIGPGQAPAAENSSEESNETTKEDIARAVWKYVQATEGLVENMDEEDELRLLRVRTKKNELVIVPSSKYLLVIVHDTPPA